MQAIDKLVQIEYYQKVRRLLAVYALKNPFVNYCQGLDALSTFLIHQEFTESVLLLGTKKNIHSRKLLL